MTTTQHPVRRAKAQPADFVTIEPVRAAHRWSPPRPVRRAAGPIGTLLLWYILSATGVLSPDVLAGPGVVLGKALSMIADGELPAAIAVSGQRVILGFAIGAAVGVALALLAGLFRIGEDLVDSTVGMFRTLPWVGLIPLIIIWFGINEEPKIALVALGVTFPMYFNIYAGIRGVDFLNRLAKAEEWANTHPEEYTEVYSKTNGVAPDIATQVVAHGRATLGPVAPDVVSKVQSVSDLMHGIGSLPSNVDVASVTDTSVFLPAAN